MRGFLKAPGFCVFFLPFAGDARYPAIQRVACFLTALIPGLYLVGSAVAHVAVILTVLLFLFHSSRTKDWEWLREPWVRLALLLWLYIVVRALFTPHVAASLGRGASWIVYPLFAAACAHWTLREKPVREALLRVLILALSFLMLDCVFQYIVGYDLFGAETVMSAEGAKRLTGPLGGPKAGIVLTWLAFPALALLLSKPGWKHRLSGGGFALLFLAVVFLSGERMALLLSLFGFALLFALLPPARKPLITLGVAGVILALLLVQANPALLKRQVSSTAVSVSEVASTSYGQIWESALRVSRDYPLFGVGVRQFRDVCRRPEYGATDAQSLIWRCNLHPHHLYLEWLVETGALGLALFLGMLVAMLRLILKHPLPNPPPDQATPKRSFSFAQARGGGDSAELEDKTVPHGRDGSLPLQGEGWGGGVSPLYTGLLIAIMLRLWPLSTAVSMFVPWSAIPFWLMLGWVIALKHDNS